MPTTRAKTVRRAAAKRTILSALDENAPSNDLDATVKIVHHYQGSSLHSDTMSNSSINGSVPPQRPFRIPKDSDCTSPESINILLQDIEREVKNRQEDMAIKCCEAIKKQHEAYFLQGMKIEKSIKKMTIKEFNEKFMKGRCSSDGSCIDADGAKKGAQEGGTDIIAMMKNIMIDSNSSNTVPVLGKKRFRNGMQGYGNDNVNGNTDLETPVRPLRVGNNIRTPATILRTAKRGEALL